MVEGTSEKIEQKENKIMNFLKNNPINMVLGFIASIITIGQYAFVVYNKINIPDFEIERKEIIYLISSIIFLFIIIFLICKNTQKNNQIKSHKNQLEKMYDIIKSYPYQFDDLIDMKKIGIVRCTSKWKETGFTTTNCMKSINKELLFMGIGGAKWIEENKERQLFEDMLKRNANNDGDVKFLIIHPYSKELKEIQDQCDRKLVTESNYKIWVDLVEKYTCLKVKCYNHTPAFRLQFMDGTLMAVARYQFASEENNGTKDCHSPHLIINNKESMSFYYVFQRYFNHEWDKATDITEIMKLK